MQIKPLLAVLFVLLLGGGAAFVWMAAGDGAVPAFAAANETRRHAAALASAGADTTANTPDAPAAASAERSTASGLPASVRPFPDDAAWFTVTVVDKETQAPVAGATVHWCEESAWSHLGEDTPMLSDESALLAQEPERLAELAGWSTVSDADGRARVTLVQVATVVAELGERYGTLQLLHNTVEPAGGHRVELEPDRSVQVHVIDARGGSCSGVLVGLTTPAATGAEVRSDRLALARTSAPDGLATLRHLQLLGRNAPEGQPGTDTHALQVVALLPAREVRGEQLSTEAPPAAPVVVQLPACGSVRVRAEYGGRPIPGFEQTTAYLYAEDGETQPYEAHVDADGWGHFPHVPLGLRLNAWSNAFGGVWSGFAGPVAPGQQIDVVLAPSDSIIVLRGRLLDHERMPLADARVVVRAEGQSFSGNGISRTDAQGRFTVSLGEAGDDSSVDHVWFDCVRQGQRTLRAALSARTLRSGIEDVGDLMPADVPLLVGGRFEGAAPSIVERLTLRVEHETPATSEEPSQWLEIGDALVHVDRGGTFTVHGTPIGANHRLVVGGEDVLPVAPIPFRPGCADLVIRLDPGSPLAASLLLPPHVPADLLSAELVPVEPATVPADLRTRLEVQADVGDAQRHHLRWHSIAAGRYTLELRPWASASVLRIPDVVVPAPDGGDPRLRDIDLCSLVRCTTLRLHGPTGEQLENASGVVFVADAMRNPEPRAFSFWGPDTKLPLPAGAVDLVVCVSGWRPKTCRCVGEQLDVRVDAWPTVHVEIVVPTPLPHGIEAHVRLVAGAGDEKTYATKYGTGRLSDLLVTPGSWVALVDGKADVAIGDGEHTLELHLANNEMGSSQSLRIRQPSSVLPTSAHVVARVPAADWQRALEALAPPK